MNETNESLVEVTSTTFTPVDAAANTTVTEIPTFIGLNVPFTTEPWLDILIVSIIAALFTTLLNKYLTDQVSIKALRKEMKKKQKDMREMLKKDPAKAQKMQMEIMQKNMEVFKHSFNFKVMAITLIPMLFIFTQIRSGYMHYDVILDVGLFSLGWLGTYIIFAIVASIVMKKALDVA